MPARNPSTDPETLRARLEEHTRVRTARWERLARLAAQESVEAGAHSGGESDRELGPPTLPTPGRHVAPRLPRLVRSVALGPAQVAVLAVMVAVALAACAFWVLRGSASEQPTTPVAVTTATTGVAEPAATATTSDAGAVTTQPSGEVVVHVDGEVAAPGIVSLPPGSRVADAIEAAGGALPGVDLAGVNLARVLVDGEQVLVGVEGSSGEVPGGSGSAGASSSGTGSTGSDSDTGLVNLNTADLALLDTLPGVGPVTAQAIVDWREENGGFTSVDELLEVSGIGEKTLADLAPLVTV